MKRPLLLLFALLVLQLSAFSAQAVSFSAHADVTCKPGKNISVTVSMQSPGETAAFLVTAESDDFAFVRAEVGEDAKNGYTRTTGEGGHGAFVYTAQSGAAGFSGEAVRFVFRAPETAGVYTVNVTVSQVANADGTMTDTTYAETLSVAVGSAATPTPEASEVSSAAESETESIASASEAESSFAESSDVQSIEESSSAVETASTAESSVASSTPAESKPETTATPTPTAAPDGLQPLPAEENHSFWQGAAAAAMAFALGIGVYVLLSKPKPSTKKEE